jgi:hypothetical protein
VDALKDRLEQGARFHGDAAQSAGKMPAELVFVEGRQLPPPEGGGL